MSESSSLRPSGDSKSSASDAASSSSSSRGSRDDLREIWGQTVSDEATQESTIGRPDADATSPLMARLAIKQRELSPEGTSSPQADYEIERLLGEGGMGLVYASRQTALDRVIAVKRMKQDKAAVGSSSFGPRDRFLAEAVVTADLEHPNIVPVYDLGQDDEGRIFYAMKYVRGVPWMEVMPDKSEEENIEILLGVADAIAFAHSRGVIHRDLKPDNVMIGDFGEVQVMDWGLASATSETSKAAKIHAFGTVSGTPAYMAPEMAKGELEQIGPWSDIYLLGALLYRIITKSPPHVGATVMDCLEAAAENDILPAWQESELLEVALKAMESDPAARFPSVKAFQTAVRDCQRHRESILLANSARETLRMANESKEYMDFARALFGCEEALKLWENNRTASELVPRVREAYAACALEKGDLDLALSLLEEGGLEEGELYQKVKRALRHRAAGERRVKAASRVAAGAIKAQSDKAARLRTYRLGLAILGGAALLAAGVAVWALLDAAKARAALRDATATAAQTPPAETKTTPAIPADAGKTP